MQLFGLKTSGRERAPSAWFPGLPDNWASPRGLRAARSCQIRQRGRSKLWTCGRCAARTGSHGGHSSELPTASAFAHNPTAFPPHSFNPSKIKGVVGSILPGGHFSNTWPNQNQVLLLDACGTLWTLYHRHKPLQLPVRRPSSATQGCPLSVQYAPQLRHVTARLEARDSKSASGSFRPSDRVALRRLGLGPRRTGHARA